MNKYKIIITAVCPPDRRWLWEQEIKNGYTVAVCGNTMRLEGREKTSEDFDKLQRLIREFPDHHVRVEQEKEVNSI